MDKRTIKEVVLASAMYSIGSILGPLLIIGGLGMLLDKLLSTGPWLLLLSILIAFVVTNILLFKKIRKINRMMDVYRRETREEREKKSLE